MFAKQMGELKDQCVDYKKTYNGQSNAIEELQESLVGRDKRIKSLAGQEEERKWLTAENTAIKTQLAGVQTLCLQLFQTVQPQQEDEAQQEQRFA